MKAFLHHIVTKNITKHVNRSKVVEIADFLKAEGYIRDGLMLTKGRHKFVFRGRRDRWTVSYCKVEIVEDDAYANYGAKLPHPQV
jgi:predicted Ser/Thr protein kinase